LKKTSGQKLAA